jgi:hypothetical protein
MATFYQRDLEQNLEPAMASPGSLIEANRLGAEAKRSRGEATKSIIGAAATAWDTGKFMEMRQLETDAEQLLFNFHTTNEAASQAGKLSQQLDVEAENMITRTMADPFHDPASIGVINNLKKQAERLKAASAGGMSRESYESRVSALSKQAIAKYPGLANEIRDVVGGITGLPGAERWAATQFVRGMFSAQQGDSTAGKLAAKMEEEEIKLIASTTGKSPLDVMNARTQNPAMYNNWKQQALEVTGTVAATEAAKKQLDQVAAQGDLTADKLLPAIAPMVRGAIQGSLLPVYQNIINNDAAFLSMTQAVRSGKFDPMNFERETGMLVANLKAGADRGRQMAMQSLEDSRGAHKWSDETHKRLQKIVEDEYASYSKLFDDKNAMSAIAAVESKYFTQTTEQKEKLIRISIDGMKMYDPNTLFAYFHNRSELPQKIREDLDKLYGPVENLRSELTNAYDPERVNVFGVVQSAETKGAAVELPANPESAKHVVETLGVKALGHVKELAKTGIITDQQALTLQAMLATSNKTGGNADMIRRDFNAFKVGLAKLPPTQFNEVKAAVNDSTVEVINKIKGADLVGISIVSTGRGAVVAVPSAEAQMSGGWEKLRKNVDKDTFYAGDVKRRIEKFNKEHAPVLNNIILTRQLVEDKDGAAIAQEYATAITAKEPYQGFFSAAPIQQTSGIEELESVLATMKQEDPDLNVDYVRRAYERATPEKQREFLAKVRESRLALSDVTAVDK